MKTLECIVLTTANPARFRVLPLIERYGWNPTFICHTEEQKAMLLGRAPRSSIVVSNAPSGIQGASYGREFARSILPRNKWVLWLDDNVEKITGLKASLSEDKVDFTKAIDWRGEFARELSKSDMDSHLSEMVSRAEFLSTIYCGVSPQENYYFRSSKWQYVGYARTQFALYKNDGSTWMPFGTMMWEDWYKSVDVITRYGSVVINRHVKSVKPLFEPGGIGPLPERLSWYKDNSEKLMALYPGLLKVRHNSSTYGLTEPNYSMTFAKRSRSTIDCWRRRHGYL